MLFTAVSNISLPHNTDALIHMDTGRQSAHTHALLKTRVHPHTQNDTKV